MAFSLRLLSSGKLRPETSLREVILKATNVIQQPTLDVEPLDESLGRRLQHQQLLVEDLTLQVAERRKRVPEQVKMLLDDAIRRQSAIADRVEFEPEEDDDMEERAVNQGKDV